MNVLVTGGTGNLGRHIVAELTKQYDLQVRVMALTAPDKEAAPGTEWAQANLDSERDVPAQCKGSISSSTQRANTSSIQRTPM